MFQVLSRKQESGKRWINVVLYSIILLLILLNLFLNLFLKCEISGVSMLNGLKDGQSVILTKTYTRINVNDTIVFKYKKGNNERLLIKRVIATSGQTIAFVANDNYSDSGRQVYLYKKSGNVYKRVDEPYIFEPMKASVFNNGSNIADVNTVSVITENIEEGAIRSSITVHKNEYYVMGDNRNISFDSRYIGVVRKDMMYAKMVYKLEKDSFLEKLCMFFYGGKAKDPIESPVFEV